MTTINFPVSWVNGNYTVTIEKDGTKTRIGRNHEPVWPESIDLKITDRCENGCGWCSEWCSGGGLHADVNTCLQVLSDAPPIEVAIGGGDVFEHPDLSRMVHSLQHLICNVTVSGRNKRRDHHQLLAWQKRGLIHGIGVSGQYGPSYSTTIKHMIVGIHSPDKVEKGDTVLLLGFKNRGRGKSIDGYRIENNTREWRFKLSRVLKTAKRAGFDNLAVEQLGLKDRVSEDTWSARFMGDDGMFSFFWDAVKDTFAPSSNWHGRIPRDGRGLREMLAYTRNLAMAVDK